jgi:hypothetical protein
MYEKDLNAESVGNAEELGKSNHFFLSGLGGLCVKNIKGDK